MEDSYTMIKDYKIGDNMDVPAVFVALFDGHAGHHGSELAAQRLHQILAEQPELQHQEGRMRRPDPNAIESALKSAFEQADIEILDESKVKGKHFGTTAVCALLWGRELTVAHAGDSRAVLCRRNEAIRLTKDHKPTNPSEKARIENLGGKILYDTDRVISNPEASGHQSSLNMSRALGDYNHKHPRPLVIAEPTVVHLQLTPDSDFVVLGTDGLFDVCSAGDCCSLVQHSLAVSAKKNTQLNGDGVAGEAARALVAEALQRGSPDNVTAAVAVLKWDHQHSLNRQQVVVEALKA